MLKEVEAAVAAANEKLARVQQVKRGALLPVEWTAETVELTPSLKLKRRVIHARYADVIDEMYESLTPVRPGAQGRVGDVAVPPRGRPSYGHRSKVGFAARVPDLGGRPLRSGAGSLGSGANVVLHPWPSLRRPRAPGLLPMAGGTAWPPYDRGVCPLPALLRWPPAAS